MLNFYIEVLDFDIEETSSKYFDIEAYFDIAGGKVPDADNLTPLWQPRCISKPGST